MKAIIEIKSWKERLSAYFSVVNDYEDMKSRIDRARRDIEFDCRDIFESRDRGWQIRTHSNPVDNAIEDLEKWEKENLQIIREYESSTLFEHDHKMKRLEQLEKEEYEHKNGIAQEHAERSRRIGYKDYGWETGSVILAIHHSALDELAELRKWRVRVTGNKINV